MYEWLIRAPARPTCSGRCRSRSTDRIEAAVASPLGPSAPAALAALEGYLGGEPIDALRTVLGLTHSGAVRLVDRLAGAGLAERRAGRDGRCVAVALTPAGERAARALREAREAALEDALAVLSAASARRSGSCTRSCSPA